MHRYQCIYLINSLVNVIYALVSMYIYLVNIPEPVQYHIYALAFPFDLRRESVTYTYNHYEPNWLQYSSLKKFN